MLNISVILFKPTKGCNAHCRHCSAYKNKGAVLSLSQAKEIIDKIAKYVKVHASLIIHGGEPMLMGVEFYDKLFNYILKNYEDKFSFSMQSNLLLYDKEWKELIKKYKIGVSTSYDFFSDIRNIKGNENLYWNEWHKKIKQYQKDMREVYADPYFSPYVICILNKQNINKVKDIYELSKKESFQIRYNYFYKVGRGIKNYEKYYISPKEYKNALETLFLLYLKDLKNGSLPKNFHIYPIDYLVWSKISYKGKIDRCPWTAKCTGSFLEIEPDGTLYNCGEIADVELFPFGNIFEINDLKKITETENFRKLYERRYKLPFECLSCKYFNYCKGGCQRDAWIKEGNIYDKTWACEAWKRIFELIEENEKTLKKHLNLSNFTERDILKYKEKNRW